MDYGQPVRFGIFLTPEATDRPLRLAALADELGYDIVGVQDHPYQRRFFDTWTLLTAIAMRTERITVFPDVANLPLRPPAMLAKAAASLDRLTGGRGGLAGSAADWAATLARWATELGFDSFVFWPSSADTAQVERFAREVIPRTRELVAQARSEGN